MTEAKLRSEMSGSVARIEGYVRAVVRQDASELSFADMYSTVFQICDTPEAEAWWQELEDCFATEIACVTQEKVTGPADAFAREFQEFCAGALKAAKVLAATFHPLELSFFLPNLNIEESLFGILRRELFKQRDNHGVGSFLKLIAAGLPGTANIEEKRALIEMVVSVTLETRMWNIFFEHLRDATDALAIELSSTLIPKHACQENVIVYLGAVLSVLEHEKKLWALLPKDSASSLRDTFLRGTIFCVSPFLTSDQSRKTLGSTFVDGFEQLDIFNQIVTELFSSRETLDSLAMTLMTYLSEKMEAVLAKVDTKRPLSVVLAKQIIDGLLDIFGRALVLQTTALGKSIAFRDSAQAVMAPFMTDPRVRAEEALCMYLGNCIELMFNEPEKECAQWRVIARCMHIARLIEDKGRFVGLFTQSMMVRMFKCAGQQYKLEKRLLDGLQPFFPPSLSAPLEDRMKEFEKSDQANQIWVRAQPKSPLRVLLFEEKKSIPISKTYRNLKLPRVLVEMQEMYMDHSRQACPPAGKGGALEFRWVYEDNLVQLQISKGKDTVFAKMPLFLAAVILFVNENHHVTLGELSTLMNWPTGQIKNLDVIVKRAIGTEFQLFNYRVVDPIENSVITFNPAYKPKRSRIVLQLPVAFSIARKALTEKAPDASPAGFDFYEAYRAAITRILKRHRRLPQKKLQDQVEAIVKRLTKFDKEVFTRALAACEKNEFCRRGETTPEGVAWHYIA